ncbi:aminoglycoside phosphotransferase family protein [Alteribacter populi]|uniref:aminoglycoside phosphotransferase family protein n=1 Tax=Alteribacter populi TaxID=2011011 RepID=UPI000BBAD990|nr:aminoglycoside phosphotransferase family protein [Alteribacter populi]
MKRIDDVLKNNYGIEPISLDPKQGGWAALAYKVSNKYNAYFLKIYEKHRASTPKLTALIDLYSPILVWLEKNSYLKGMISVPLLSKDGHYKCEDSENIYLLYNYIDGETVGKKELTEKQIREFSQIIAELHSFGEEIPVQTNAIIEDFEVSFLDRLEEVLDRPKENLPEELNDLISKYKQNVIALILQIKVLSNKLKTNQLSMSLCHTDLHNWNLMQTENLMLIDWEGLKIAPVEADMMFLVDKPYFDDFLRIYKEEHPDYSINQDALNFYQLKRRLEDTWEFIEQLLFEELETKDKNEALYYLKDLMGNID